MENQKPKPQKPDLLHWAFAGEQKPINTAHNSGFAAFGRYALPPPNPRSVTAVAKEEAQPLRLRSGFANPRDVRRNGRFGWLGDWDREAKTKHSETALIIPTDL
jgi:hypothetical protein